jgi:hypothetical protein
LRSSPGAGLSAKPQRRPASPPGRAWTGGPTRQRAAAGVPARGARRGQRASLAARGETGRGLLGGGGAGEPPRRAPRRSSEGAPRGLSSRPRASGTRDEGEGWTGQSPWALSLWPRPSRRASPCGYTQGGVPPRGSRGKGLAGRCGRSALRSSPSAPSSGSKVCAALRFSGRSLLASRLWSSHPLPHCVRHGCSSTFAETRVGRQLRKFANGLLTDQAQIASNRLNREQIREH